MPEENKDVLSLYGRIDAVNAPLFGQQLTEMLNSKPNRPLVVDCGELEYISSAGLRVLLTVQKKSPYPVTLLNVSPSIYEILDMTGFTSILKVERKLRSMDITGCEIIGRGAVSTVYRIDRETIVKVYEIPNALEMIRNEQKRAKQALLKGIPTAISYDAVRVGDRYGSVFELVNARTFAEVLSDQPERMDELVRLHTDVIRSLHSVEADSGELPDCREIYLEYLDAVGREIPEELALRMRELIAEIPYDRHLIHGDIHMKNVMLCDGEALLIDMDTLSCGNPVFDLADLFIAYMAFNEDEPDNSRRVIGLSADICAELWQKTVACYLGPTSDDTRREAMDQMMALGYLRFLYLVAGLNLGGDNLRGIRIQHAVNRLRELLGTVDHLAI